MSFMLQLLGPVEAIQDGHRLSLGPPKRRAMLTALALDANRVVSLDRLTQSIWTAPPASAVANLRSHAGELRHALSGRIAAKDGGYVLAVRPGELDMEDFLRLAASGRRALAAGDAAHASVQLGEALRHWRGQAADGLDVGPSLDVRLRSLDELRLDAFEDYLQARQAVSAYPDTVAELWTHVQEHPLRERAWGLLMLALYRTGNTAAALDSFAQARAVLAEQLGVGPGPELAALHRAILDRDASLDASPPGGQIVRQARAWRFRSNVGPAYGYPAA